MTTKPTRCPAGGEERSWTEDAWVNSEGYCPDCGAPCRVWVRGDDLFPRAKVGAHKVPAGVTSAPYAIHPSGGPGRGDA